jgi:hypothetical protein
MRVKIFNATTASGLEDETNKWLASQTSEIEISRTEFAVAQSSGAGAVPNQRYAVAIWYRDMIPR